MNLSIIFLAYNLYLTNNNDDDNKFFCQGIVMVIKQCVKACSFVWKVYYLYAKLSHLVQI